MAFQPAVDTIELVMDFLMSGAPTANVLHFRKTGGYNQAEIDALAAGMSAGAGSQYVPTFTPTQQFVGVRIRGLAVDGDITASSSVGAGTGTTLYEALPNNVSLCLTLRTGLTGRSNRGRFYCQPPSTNNMAGPNIVLDTYKDGQINALNALIAYAGASGWDFVIVSRWSNKVLRPTAVMHRVTSVIARNTRTDSQRGRMPLPT